MTLCPREDIYLTLLSNVPDVQGNTSTHYTTNLPTPGQSKSQWEVASLKTHYSHDMSSMLSSMIGDAAGRQTMEEHRMMLQRRSKPTPESDAPSLAREGERLLLTVASTDLMPPISPMET